MDWLLANKELILIFHVAGMAVGLGSATVVDTLFFKFLKDFKISKIESSVLETLSVIIWVALGIVVLSGAALYLPQTEVLNSSPKFLAKMIIVGIILVNGSLLNFYISPKLRRISFGKKHHHHKGELHHLRRLAFSLGPISIISWYSAFVLGMLREVSLPLLTLLGIYGALLLLGMLFGQLIERYYTTKALKQ